MLGENGQQFPATPADAAQYKAQQNLPEDMIVVADGGFQKIRSSVNIPLSLSLPFMAVLGGDMEILGIDVNNQEFLSLVQGATGQEFPQSCEGSCGTQSLGGCYCDASCQQYEDCCPDYEQVCL